MALAVLWHTSASAISRSTQRSSFCTSSLDHWFSLSVPLTNHPVDWFKNAF
jgi:hypothetical protein